MLRGKSLKRHYGAAARAASQPATAAQQHARGAALPRKIDLGGDKTGGLLNQKLKVPGSIVKVKP